MRTVIYICAAAMISGCADQARIGRWNDMWVDIAIRHKLEKYSCAAQAREGYAKDPPMRVVARRGPAREAAAPVNRDAEAQRTAASIRELNARIESLEDALKTNAATTNQNQALIVDQIKALKAKLEASQQK